MALESLLEVGKALDLQTLKDKKPSLVDVLRELQGLKLTLATGGTSVTVTGITTSDTLLSVLCFVGAAAATPDVTTVTDVTANASISAANTVAISSGATANDKVLVIWYDKA